MHATIDVRFTISIDEDKTIPLATIAEFLSEQNIESTLLESIVESLDAARVEALNHRFEQYRFDILLGNELGKGGERYRFVLVDANREPHVDCGVHGCLVGWTAVFNHLKGVESPVLRPS